MYKNKAKFTTVIVLLSIGTLLTTTSLFFTFYCSSLNKQINGIDIGIDIQQKSYLNYDSQRILIKNLHYQREILKEINATSTKVNAITDEIQNTQRIALNILYVISYDKGPDENTQNMWYAMGENQLAEVEQKLLQIWISKANDGSKQKSIKETSLENYSYWTLTLSIIGLILNQLALALEILSKNEVEGNSSKTN